MNIVYFANGNSVAIQRWMLALQEKGYDISLFTIDPIPDDLRQKGIQVYSLKESRRPEKITVDRRITMTKILRYIKSLVFNLFPKLIREIINYEVYSRRARKILNDIKPEIVHGHFATRSGYIAARTGFHPLVLTTMGTDVLINTHLSVWYRVTLKHSLNKSDAITASSNYLGKAIESFGGQRSKIHIFPRGVSNLICFNEESRLRIRTVLGWKKNKIVIMTRNFQPVYGVEYFIEVLPAIFKTEPDARAIFVGDGPLREDFEKRVKELKIENYVKFVGFINDNRMASYLNAANIYVTTSLSDGSSNSLLEAMACRLPVIVSDVPSNLEWIEDGINGFIVPRKDSFMLSKRIIELLQNPERCKEMGKRNLQIVRQRADWDKNFKILENIYADLVNRQNLKDKFICK